MSNGKQFLDHTEPQLELILGHDLLSGLGAKEPSDYDKRRAATSWLTKNISKMRSVICDNSVVRGYLRDDTKQDAVIIVGTVFDILNHQFNGFSTEGLGALAALLVNFRLKTLCPENHAD